MKVKRDAETGLVVLLCDDSEKASLTWGGVLASGTAAS